MTTTNKFNANVSGNLALLSFDELHAYLHMTNGQAQRAEANDDQRSLTALQTLQSLLIDELISRD